jgi:DNA gyrase subunit A
MMYKMGLLSGARRKSADVVGQTMQLNPHGDMAIYETLVRLTRANDAMLHPFLDSKGSFGKQYSRDMAYAASRYTEVKLDAICGELFRDIEKQTDMFVDNYNGLMKEPLLLPATFPNVLVTPNQGIAVGMASRTCGFNLTEVCEAAIAYIKNNNVDLPPILKAPDFSTGGELLYNESEIRQIYATGEGSFKLRARYTYDKKNYLIEVYEIPYTTTVEAIIDKLAELIKSGKVKDVTDVRDETDLHGLKLTLDLRRGTDPDKLMRRLFKVTPLNDSFACNFNVLIGGTPQLLGVGELLTEWEAWRTECVRRRLYFEAGKLRDKLHLLRGLAKILLDIDRAIAIIRETEEESEVVPNLMIGFGIDALQAEYVADIRLRDINRQYILRRVGEVESLAKELAGVEAILADKNKVKDLIVKELQAVAKKYGKPRKTLLVHADEQDSEPEEEAAESYPVHIFLSKQGYFKKITPLSLRMGGEHKWKEDDGLAWSAEAMSGDEILVFSTKQQVYKTRLSEFEDTKASLLGEWLPGKLGMDEGELVAFAVMPGDYSGSILLFYANGKAARVALSAYATVGNRRRLTGAYSEKSALMAALPIGAECEIFVTGSNGRALIFHTAALAVKTTRATQGVALLNVSGRHTLTSAVRAEEGGLTEPARSRFRVRNIPAAGATMRAEDKGEEQIAL